MISLQGFFIWRTRRSNRVSSKLLEKDKLHKIKRVRGPTSGITSLSSLPLFLQAYIRVSEISQGCMESFTVNPKWIFSVSENFPFTQSGRYFQSFKSFLITNQFPPSSPPNLAHRTQLPTENNSPVKSEFPWLVAGALDVNKAEKPHSHS